MKRSTKQPKRKTSTPVVMYAKHPRRKASRLTALRWLLPMTRPITEEQSLLRCALRRKMANPARAPLLR